MSPTTKEYATKVDVKGIVTEAVEGLARLISTTCATKEDVALCATKEELAAFRVETQQSILEVRDEVMDIRATMATKKDMKRLETKLDFLIEDHEVTKTRVTHLEKGLTLVQKKM